MSLRKFTQMAFRSAFRDGDLGIQPVESEGSILMNPIECDRIGNPMSAITYSKKYVSGFHLNETSQKTEWVEVYERTDSGIYVNPQMLPANQFWHVPFFNRFDQFRGVTGFYAAITRLRDLAETMGYEISGVKWASTIAGVVVRKAGLASLEEEDYYNDAPSLPPLAPEARENRLKTVQPAEINYLEEGEDLRQFINQRPATAWQGFMQLMMKDICVASKVPFSFAYDPSGVQGTALRLDSQKAQRAFQELQLTAEEQFLNEWVELQLADGIVKKEIPPDKNWKRGKFRYGAHPTMDIGRESQANLAENRQGLKSGDAITSESGEDIYEVQEQLANEAANILRLSKDKGVPVSMIQSLSKEGNTMNDPVQGVHGQSNAPEKPDPEKESPAMKDLHRRFERIERAFASGSREKLLLEKSLITDEITKVETDGPEWAFLTDRLKEVNEELGQ